MEQLDDEINIIKEKDFILTSNKKIEYKLKLFITYDDLFCINIFTTKSFPSKKYSLSLKMEDLINNRFFKIFINVEEIFRELENKIEKSTIIEDSNIIYLDIPIGLTVINDIIIEIKESQKTNEEIIQELRNELNNKNKIINQNEIKIKELENKLKEKEIKSNQNEENFNNEIQKLKNIIEKNKEELDKLNGKNIFSDSILLKNNINSINLIKNGIKFKLNKNIKSTKLLYRVTRDGNDRNIFHQKCDGISNTLIVGESTNGRIFGGFTTQKWDTSSGSKMDEYAFLFQLKDMKIYYSIKGKGAIYCGNGFGPTFGNNSYFHLCFQDSLFGKNREDSIKKNVLSYQYDEKELNMKYIFDGNNIFNLKDYEVFELSLD